LAPPKVKNTENDRMAFAGHRNPEMHGQHYKYRNVMDSDLLSEERRDLVSEAFRA